MLRVVYSWIVHDYLGTVSNCRFICDGIGRKWACLLTIIPFSLGWGLVIWSTGTRMIYFGRFLTGLAGKWAIFT